MRERERKNMLEGKKERKKKDCVFACPCVELTPFMLSQLSNTVYQCKELT